METKQWLTQIGMVLCLGVVAQAQRAVPRSVSKRPTPEQWAQRCVSAGSDRHVFPNGTAMQGMTLRDPEDARSEVLTYVMLGSLPLDGNSKGGLLQGTRLLSHGATDTVQGATLEGIGGDGQPVDVVICDVVEATEAEPMTHYRLRYWEAKEQRWQNPCAGSPEDMDPYAVAVSGRWDDHGGHHRDAGSVTFACPTGAINKCMQLGYRPGARDRSGAPVDDAAMQALHQACTRMIRADYCGNGTSHTADGREIDIYDRMAIKRRTRNRVGEWDPEQAQLEASWDEEGAVCIDHTRSGAAMERILAECPGRFVLKALDLGDGDRCTYRRRGASAKDVRVLDRFMPKAPPAAAR